LIHRCVVLPSGPWRGCRDMDERTAILKTTLIIYACVFALAGLLTLAFRGANWGRNIRVAILSWLVIFLLFIFLGYAGLLPF